MAKKEELILNISQEELVYLLGLLKTKTIPGLYAEMFQGVTERDWQIALGVAERALLARGFIRPSETGTQIDEVPMAMVGTCARPDYSVILEISGEELRSGHFWHEMKGFIVEHSLPVPGIHKLRALEDRSGFIERVGAVTGELDAKTAVELNCTLSENTYQAAYQMLQNKADKNAIQQTLENGKLVPETAEVLASAMLSATKSVQIGFIHHHREGGDAEVFGGTLNFSPEKSYLVLSLPGEELEIIAMEQKNWRSWLDDQFTRLSEA